MECVHACLYACMRFGVCVCVCALALVCVWAVYFIGELGGFEEEVCLSVWVVGFLHFTGVLREEGVFKRRVGR